MTTEDDSVLDLDSLPQLNEPDQDPAPAVTATTETPTPAAREQSSFYGDDDEDSADDTDDADDDDQDPEGEQSDDDAEPAPFDPTNADTWPESDQAHVRAAQARMTRYEQEIAAQRQALGGAEAVDLVQALSQAGIGAGEVLEMLRANAPDPTQVSPTAPSGTPVAPGYTPAPTPFVATLPPELRSHPNAPLSPHALSILEAHNAAQSDLDEGNYQTDVEERLLRNQITSLSVQYQSVQDQARYLAGQQEQARSSSLNTELTRLEADARYRTFLSDPKSKQSVLDAIQKTPGLSMEDVVRIKHYDQLLIDSTVATDKARKEGLKQGRTGRQAAEEDSLSRGQGTRSVKVSDTIPPEIARDPHRLLQFVRNRNAIK